MCQGVFAANNILITFNNFFFKRNSSKLFACISKMWTRANEYTAATHEKLISTIEFGQCSLLNPHLHDYQKNKQNKTKKSIAIFIIYWYI